MMENLPGIISDKLFCKLSRVRQMYEMIHILSLFSMIKDTHVQDKMM